MKYRKRTFYSEADKQVMWERWQRGDSLHDIAQLFDRPHSSIQGIFAKAGGVRPRPRRWSRLALTLFEDGGEIEVARADFHGAREVGPAGRPVVERLPNDLVNIQ